MARPKASRASATDASIAAAPGRGGRGGTLVVGQNPAAEPSPQATRPLPVGRSLKAAAAVRPWDLAASLAPPASPDRQKHTDRPPASKCEWRPSPPAV